MKKILIIRFSSIGDIVLTSPVIRCVKKQLPGAGIHFLTKAAFAPIVSANPYVDKVWTLSDDLKEVTRELKKESFDFVIDLHHNLRSLRVKKALGAPGAAFDKLNIEKWLLVNFKLNRLPPVHIVDRYMAAAASLGVHYDGLGLDYFIPAADEVETGTLPSPWSSGYAAFVIGARHATKRMPVSKMIAIIQLMQLPVILLGGNEDAVAAQEIRNACSKWVLNGCGTYKLSQSASLVRQSRFVITHDTGLMHIAAAYRKRILSVWGNTVPEFGMTPFLPESSGASILIENKILKCRPCTKIGYDSCPIHHFKCMLDLDNQLIANQGIEWWKVPE